MVKFPKFPLEKVAEVQATSRAPTASAILLGAARSTWVLRCHICPSFSLRALEGEASLFRLGLRVWVLLLGGHTGFGLDAALPIIKNMLQFP